MRPTAQADAAAVAAAVDRAAAAMAAGGFPRAARAAVLDRAAALLAERAEELSRVVCRDARKPIRLARVEVERAEATLRESAAECRRLAGRVVAMDDELEPGGLTARTIRVPVGVLAAITPFNFPLNLALHKVAPAIAAGCATVLKPSPRTPEVGPALARLFADAGLPADWLTVIDADPEQFVDVVADDERVGAISFTGSAAIGWGIRARAPKKRVALELGNSTPAIVCASADVALAAERLAQGAFAFSGQSCISVQRVFAHRSVHRDLLERMVAYAEALRPGDPEDEATDIGPVIDTAARERIVAWIEEAREAGARIVTGGGYDGDIVEPTILTETSPDLSISCREVFGPVCLVEPVDSTTEAIARANSTGYGLQAAVWTSDLKEASAAARELRFGGVLVNESPTFRADHMPYGGVKDSGNTREGPAYTIRELTEERLVLMRMP